ncbi:MAG: hypothetical protein CVV02_12090 [Firmicutes bacterium HGW-Firmicutes-7]|nr:MAG: hypothetical protein CVV02_12090 [Firmicutes bacterium HGW-Firmicutes-7]
MKIGIREIIAALDFFAIAIFLGASLFAIIKPQKAHELLRSKKKKDSKPDIKTLNKVRIYAIAIFVLVAVGLIEKFI